MAAINQLKEDGGIIIPRHIAIILDGNGRWAKKRGLPRTAGHAAGAETFRKIATYCKNIGVQYLTVYAFSTENWSRPEEEVKSIMKLLDKYLHEAIATMERDHIRMKILGDVSALSPSLRAEIMRFQVVMRGSRRISASITGAGRRSFRQRSAMLLILQPAGLHAISRKPVSPLICILPVFPIRIF